MIDVLILFTVDTAASLLDFGLDVAQAVGLPVTSWRAGDPTRSTFEFLADALATRDQITVDFAKSAFLSTVEDNDFADLHALDVYGVDRIQATNSTPTVTLFNAGGGIFPVEAGSHTFKCSATGATFHVTGVLAPTPGPSGVLFPGQSMTLSLVSDDAGSSATVTDGEIDQIVTTMLGVEITASTSSIALNKQDLESLKQDCRDTRGALSPDGPPDAYEFVARQEALTGSSVVTRSRSTNDSDTLEVTVYIAGADGDVDMTTVTQVQAAIEIWATPLCVRPTVLSATNTPINIVAAVTGPDVPADFIAQCTDAIRRYLNTLPIADESGGIVYIDPLRAVFHTLPFKLTNVVHTIPAADIPYDPGHVPVLGAVLIIEV